MIARIRHYLDGEGDDFNWKLPLCAAVAPFVVFVPAVIYNSLLLYGFVSTLILSPVSAFFVNAAFGKKRRRCLSLLAVLVLYSATSVGLIVCDLRNPYTIRWWALSRSYKARVLAQPASANGDLKHIEWDGWGWAGTDVTVYLVFDPADSLSKTADGNKYGRFSGIPCDVVAVRRFESHWYTVQLSANEFWERRNLPDCGF